MTTHWSVVSDVSSPDVAPDRAHQALTRLCRDYWPPLYRFIRWRGYSPADAQDLTQGFFAYLVEKRVYLGRDRINGRFRSFLLMLCKRYLRGARAYENRQKRGGGQRPLCIEVAEFSALDESSAEASLATRAPLDEERLFERNWAAQLVGRAMQALRAEYSTAQKAPVFAELRPFLTGGINLPTQAEAAARLGVSEETLRSHLFRLRARYRALLRAEVGRTVREEKEIDHELRYLCRVLIASA